MKIFVDPNITKDHDISNFDLVEENYQTNVETCLTFCTIQQAFQIRLRDSDMNKGLICDPHSMLYSVYTSYLTKSLLLNPRALYAPYGELEAMLPDLTHSKKTMRLR